MEFIDRDSSIERLGKLNEKGIRIKRASGDVEKSSPISLVSHSARSSVTVGRVTSARVAPINVTASTASRN